MNDIFGNIAQYLCVDDQYSLIKAYSDPYYLNQYEYSPNLTYLLITNNDSEIIKQIYRKLSNHYKLFRWAAENGCLDIVKFLVMSSKVNPSYNDNLAIRHASEYGHLDVVQRMLR